MCFFVGGGGKRGWDGSKNKEGSKNCQFTQCNTILVLSNASFEESFDIY